MGKVVELLSPAKNLNVAIVAIDNGADAVYIGAPDFGARSAASNSLEDIKELTSYAHAYYCRVYVTLNTILYDDELILVQDLINKLYKIGVDALIIQDLGILKLDLPPIALHASTQLHNYDLEKIKFLDKLGFNRIILARELSLDQLRKIRSEVHTELECFVHGALCVSMSGQCYMSQALYGRSANRGECAQPCRMKWSLKDSNDKFLLRDKRLLSLKDFNLSNYLQELVKIGIESFKIEGRLKDEDYVANVTASYSQELNKIIENSGGQMERVSSGNSIINFKPDVENSFNRGFTDYFIKDRQKSLINLDTPKSMGKFVATVKDVQDNKISIIGDIPIHNGDGFSYMKNGILLGFRVNVVDGNVLICSDTMDIKIGTSLYRNYDHEFVKKIKKSSSKRKIDVDITVLSEANTLKFLILDEDNISADYEFPDVFEVAKNENQIDRIKSQVLKNGDSKFICKDVNYFGPALFVPSSEINKGRNILKQNLETNRLLAMTRLDPFRENKDVKFPYESLDWTYNVVNKNALEFYKEHGALSVDEGYEIEKIAGRRLMHTKYCILYELGRCKKYHKNEDLKFPLVLFNDSHSFVLDFECKDCFMSIYDKDKLK